MDAGMSNVLLASTMLKIGYAGLAFFTISVFVRFMEFVFDIKAREAWDKINDSPMAVAIFMGSIILAGSHLIGMLWS